MIVGVELKVYFGSTIYEIMTLMTNPLDLNLGERKERKHKVGYNMTQEITIVIQLIH